MDKRVFERLREIIYQTSGIALNDQKEALVSARVAKRIRALGLADHKEYTNYLTSDENADEIVHLLDAISTNVTHFFRESHHFDVITQAVTEWLKQGQNRFRFWSAGCSSGEEPYSLGITILEALNGRSPDIKILATDISTKILHKSMSGVYQKKDIEKVPPLLRERFFDKEGTGESSLYAVSPKVKSMITFKRLNLSVVPFPMSGPMDAIFCRNVMIYFDNSVRKNLLGEFHRLLKPGGYLMVGHAESLTGILSGFKVIMPSVYIKS